MFPRTSARSAHLLRLQAAQGTPFQPFSTSTASAYADEPPKPQGRGRGSTGTITLGGKTFTPTSAPAPTSGSPAPQSGPRGGPGRGGGGFYARGGAGTGRGRGRGAGPGGFAPPRNLIRQNAPDSATSTPSGLSARLAQRSFQPPQDDPSNPRPRSASRPSRFQGAPRQDAPPSWTNSRTPRGTFMRSPVESSDQFADAPSESGTTTKLPAARRGSAASYSFDISDLEDLGALQTNPDQPSSPRGSRGGLRGQGSFRGVERSQFQNRFGPRSDFGTREGAPARGGFGFSRGRGADARGGRGGARGGRGAGRGRGMARPAERNDGPGGLDDLFASGEPDGFRAPAPTKVLNAQGGWGEELHPSALPDNKAGLASANYTDWNGLLAAIRSSGSSASVPIPAGIVGKEATEGRLSASTLTKESGNWMQVVEGREMTKDEVVSRSVELLARNPSLTRKRATEGVGLVAFAVASRQERMEMTKQ